MERAWNNEVDFNNSSVGAEDWSGTVRSAGRGAHLSAPFDIYRGHLKSPSCGAVFGSAEAACKQFELSECHNSAWHIACVLQLSRTKYPLGPAKIKKTFSDWSKTVLGEKLQKWIQPTPNYRDVKTTKLKAEKLQLVNNYHCSEHSWVSSTSWPVTFGDWSPLKKFQTIADNWRGNHHSQESAFFIAFAIISPTK